MGSATTPERLTARVLLLFTPSQLQRIDQRAASEEISRAVWIRQWLDSVLDGLDAAEPKYPAEPEYVDSRR